MPNCGMYANAVPGVGELTSCIEVKKDNGFW